MGFRDNPYIRKPQGVLALGRVQIHSSTKSIQTGFQIELETDLHKESILLVHLHPRSVSWIALVSPVDIIAGMNADDDVNSVR